MSAIYGFELTREQEIPELRTKARLLRHVKTGARLLSLINDDENKVFGITFRTPPQDSTGLPHILEHSVLCGSRKYPVKEPFVELLKSSLQSFLNAMTYPDKTCYPVASQNTKDFYNLIDVYLDAVFYPRLTKEVFEQEGWHFELDEARGALTYKGVVFSEMKGAYSSPDNLLAEYSQQSLFPDTPYGLDSGGDPKEIPNLTFDKFKAFHEKYYHPSNAWVYFYGDDDPEERLRVLDAYLRDFQRIPVDSAVPLQPSFKSPRRIVRPFPVSEQNARNLKGMFTSNWLLDEAPRTELNMAFHMLEYVLLGMPGSPLRKALIDSGYGEDIAGQGLGSDIRQMYFSAGLKGINPDDAGKVEALIFKTLEKLANKGFDPLTIEAAINTIEFALRENNTGNYPRGLALMLRALTAWLYEEDPIPMIAFEQPLESVKQRIASERFFFESLIKHYLLKNPHRTSLLLKPDPDLARKEEERERDRLGKLMASLSPEDSKKIMLSVEKLRKMQQTPDSPEALAAIPTLKVSDLSRHNKVIPVELFQEKGARLLYHDIFTSDIVYVDLGFDLHLLPQELISYVPMFARALLEMGTEKEDYVSLTQRISRKTGGIHTALHTSVVKNSEKSTAWMLLRGKAMVRQVEELLAILQDVLLAPRLDDQVRFRQMVLESKARLEHAIIPSGHHILDLRLRTAFSEADWVAEQMSGISYLLFLRELEERVEKDWVQVLSALEKIRELLINRHALLLNITVDEKKWLQIQAQVEAFLDSLPYFEPILHSWKPRKSSDFEGLTIPAQVNYVGKGMNLFSHGYRFHGSAHVITRYLRNSWLWEKVRVEGGAYGAFCLFDRLSGVLTLVSYRDPNIFKTLEAFEGAAGFLKGLDLSATELTRAIVGAIGDIDRYQLPDAKGYTSMVRYLSGETEPERQRIREEVLGTTVQDFNSFGAVLEEGAESALVKILGPKSAIEEVAAKKRWGLKVFDVL